jgi:glutaminyl-peptide cyclotransferase
MMLTSLALALALARAGPGVGATPVYGYRVVRVFPHDPNAFTEGLFYEDGLLWESTGMNGQSSVRKEELETGKVIEQHDMPNADFGEGIVKWRSNLYQLTWQEHFGYVYDPATLKVRTTFHYPGEGWALTKDAHHIYMSDGTADLRVLDPVTLKEQRRIHVTDDGRPIDQLNELEWVKGEIYANVWHANWIARIDPASGQVVGLINLTGILSPSNLADGPDGVLNGIAYDPAGDRLFVTGKDWPKVFEIRLHEHGAAPFAN